MLCGALERAWQKLVEQARIRFVASVGGAIPPWKGATSPRFRVKRCVPWQIFPSGSSYYLPRAAVLPEEALLEKASPDVDRWLQTQEAGIG